MIVHHLTSSPIFGYEEKNDQESSCKTEMGDIVHFLTNRFKLGMAMGQTRLGLYILRLCSDFSRTFLFSVHLHSESDYAYSKFVPTRTLGPPTESDCHQTLSLWYCTNDLKHTKLTKYIFQIQFNKKICTLNSSLTWEIFLILQFNKIFSHFDLAYFISLDLICRILIDWSK